MWYFDGSEDEYIFDYERIGQAKSGEEVKILDDDGNNNDDDNNNDNLRKKIIIITGMINETFNVVINNIHNNCLIESKI